MLDTRWRTTLARTAVAGVLAASALTTAACSSDDESAGGETGTSVGDVQEQNPGEDSGLEDAPYDGTFEGLYPNILDFTDREVTVSARVDEVLTPQVILIGGSEGLDSERLVVVSPVGISGLETEQLVEVTGTVQDSFDVPRLESELGIDLRDDFLEDWEDQPYVLASEVDTTTSGQ